MSGKIKQFEDVYIEGKKKELKKVGGEMGHDMELAMRIAYNAGAVVFHELGRHEGDENRKRKIFEALGLVAEESMD